MTASLARRFGGEPQEAEVTRGEVRSLEEIARENAVEGCVRETYGALLGAWQAEAAEDAVVRAAMRKIAEDEARHAALAWEVAAWARAKLDADAQQRIDEAQAAEVRRMETELAFGPSTPLVRLGGLPDAVRAQALFAALQRAVGEQFAQAS